MRAHMRAYTYKNVFIYFFKSHTHLYSEGAGVSRPLRKVPSISAARESMGRTEARAVYRCTVLLGRLLFRKFLMSSRASQSMSSHSEYLSCRSLSCRQGEIFRLYHKKNTVYCVILNMGYQQITDLICFCKDAQEQICGRMQRWCFWVIM